MSIPLLKTANTSRYSQALRQAEPINSWKVQTSLFATEDCAMPDTDTRSLQQIKRETEQTRAGLTNTVEQLKTSVADTASEIRQRIAPDAIKAEVSDYIKSRGEQLVNDVTSAARKNPMQAVAVGASSGLPAVPTGARHTRSRTDGGRWLVSGRLQDRADCHAKGIRYCLRPFRGSFAARPRLGRSSRRVGDCSEKLCIRPVRSH